MRVLIVCAANTCRSPMLEFMLKDYLSRQDVKSIEINSRGFSGGGEKMNPETERALSAKDVKFDKNFKSRKISEKDLENVDFILAVEQIHKIRLIEAFGDRENLFSVKDICGVDVFDPYGQGREAYETVADIFEKAIPDIVKAVLRA